MAAATSLSAAELSERGRLAANTRWAREDPREQAARARTTLLERFRLQADPDGTLPALEADRRAEKLLDAHMAKMRFAKSRARIAEKTNAPR